MSREIKFRGRSSAEAFEADDSIAVNMGDWIYGNLIVDKNQAYIVNGVVECTGEYISLENWCPVDIETVGQYTGLKDRNGVEIYEGDIVEYYSGEMAQSPYWTRVIEWRDSSIGIGFNFGKRQSSSSYHVVIGNIYENPELLEAEL